MTPSPEVEVTAYIVGLFESGRPLDGVWLFFLLCWCLIDEH